MSPPWSTLDLGAVHVEVHEGDFCDGRNLVQVSVSELDFFLLFHLCVGPAERALRSQGEVLDRGVSGVERWDLTLRPVHPVNASRLPLFSPGRAGSEVSRGCRRHRPGLSPVVACPPAVCLHSCLIRWYLRQVEKGSHFHSGTRIEVRQLRYGEVGKILGDPVNLRRFPPLPPTPQVPVKAEMTSTGPVYT